MRTMIAMTPVLLLGCGDPATYEANLKAEALMLKSPEQVDEADCDVANVYLESSTEDDAVAAELEELCGPGGCTCDCTAATLACRALATCGNGGDGVGHQGQHLQQQRLCRRRRLRLRDLHRGRPDLRHRRDPGGLRRAVAPVVPPARRGSGSTARLLLRSGYGRGREGGPWAPPGQTASGPALS